jgi:hypothetical protein
MLVLLLDGYDFNHQGFLTIKAQQAQIELD